MGIDEALRNAGCSRWMMLFLFLILNSNSMINESGFMPDFLFSVNRYYDIIETNLTQI